MENIHNQASECESENDIDISKIFLYFLFSTINVRSSSSSSRIPECIETMRAPKNIQIKVNFQIKHPSINRMESSNCRYLDAKWIKIKILKYFSCERRSKWLCLWHFSSHFFKMSNQRDSENFHFFTSKSTHIHCTPTRSSAQSSWLTIANVFN